MKYNKANAGNRRCASESGIATMLIGEGVAAACSVAELLRRKRRAEDYCRRPGEAMSERRLLSYVAIDCCSDV
jgi:hypothetical protein